MSINSLIFLLEYLFCSCQYSKFSSQLSQFLSLLFVDCTFTAQFVHISLELKHFYISCIFMFRFNSCRFVSILWVYLSLVKLKPPLTTQTQIIFNENWTFLTHKSLLLCEQYIFINKISLLSQSKCNVRSLKTSNMFFTSSPFRTSPPPSWSFTWLLFSLASDSNLCSSSRASRRLSAATSFFLAIIAAYRSNT